MCVVSMIMDHYHDKWSSYSPWRIDPFPNGTPPPYTCPPQVPVMTLPTQAEIDEFRKLLERARKYDADNGEPNCELEEKRKKLLDLAEQLGIKIDFL